MFKKTQTCAYLPTDEFLHQALVYLYRKATKEVIQFTPKEKVEKIGVLKDDILFSKGRIMEGMNFTQTGGIKVTGLGNLGLRSHVPVIDRFSPLAYAIGNYVHWELSKHRGAETCNRLSLEYVSIVQSSSLYKEIGDNCVWCRMKRKRFVDVPMGLISDYQLNVSPPFWVSQADIFGPIHVFVPGFERKTRNRQVVEAKTWVLVFVCPVTRLINLQVIEKSDSSGIVEGLTRLSCEVGVPKVILIDQDSALIKALTEVEFEFVTAKLEVHRALGIEFATCPVSGHNMHGQVERRIRTVQESLEEAGLKQKSLHATGLQTMLKLVENQINNLPIGYSFGRDQDNTSLLKMLTPNMMRVGRSNERSLNGPMKLVNAPSDLLKQVQDTYEAWFRVWNTVYLPKLMFQPKWWRQEVDLKENDVVLFRKHDSDVSSPWILGTIEQLVVGRDGLARRAILKHKNAAEDTPRLTDRHVRKLVKVWSVEDQSIEEDLAAVHRKLEECDQSGRISQLVLQSRYLQGEEDRSPDVLKNHVSCGVYCAFTYGGTNDLDFGPWCTGSKLSIGEDTAEPWCSGSEVSGDVQSPMDSGEYGLRKLEALMSIQLEDVLMDDSYEDEDMEHYDVNDGQEQSVVEIMENLNLFLE